MSEQSKEACRICLKQIRLVDLQIHSKYCQDQTKVRDQLKKIDSDIVRDCHKATGLKNKVKFEIMSNRHKHLKIDSSGMASERASVGGEKMSLRQIEASRNKRSGSFFNIHDELLGNNNDNITQKAGTFSARSRQLSEVPGKSNSNRFEQIVENSEDESTPAKDLTRVKRHSRFFLVKQEDMNKLVQSTEKDKEDDKINANKIKLPLDENNSSSNDLGSHKNNLQSPTNRLDQNLVIKKLKKQGTENIQVDGLKQTNQKSWGEKPTQSYRDITEIKPLSPNTTYGISLKDTGSPNKNKINSNEGMSLHFESSLAELAVQNSKAQMVKISSGSGDNIYLTKARTKELQMNQSPLTAGHNRNVSGIDSFEIKSERKMSNQGSIEQANDTYQPKSGIKKGSKADDRSPSLRQDYSVKNIQRFDGSNAMPFTEKKIGERDDVDKLSGERDSRRTKHLNEIVELLEGIEAYGRDITKYEFTLQVDITIEVKAQQFRSVFGLEKMDPTSSEPKPIVLGNSDFENNLDIELDVLGYLRDIIPLYNLVVDAASRRKVLLGKLINIENMMHQNDTASNNNSNNQSRFSQDQSAQNMKPRSVMSSSFRIFRNPVSINSGKNNYIGADRIEEDENENRPSIRGPDPKDVQGQYNSVGKSPNFGNFTDIYTNLVQEQTNLSQPLKDQREITQNNEKLKVNSKVFADLDESTHNQYEIPVFNRNKSKSRHDQSHNKQVRDDLSDASSKIEAITESVSQKKIQLLLDSGEGKSATDAAQAS